MWRFRLFKTIQWKIVVMYILLILLAMQFIGAYFAREVETYYINNFSETLNAQATMLAVALEKHLDPSQEKKETTPQMIKSDIDNLIYNMVALNGAQVQVIDQNGTIVSTTESEQAIVGQRTSQNEVTIALMGTRNEGLRIDPFTGDRVKVLAVPVKRGNIVFGAVYMVVSMEPTYETIRKITSILATGTGIALLMTAALGVVLARTITKPVKEMTLQATAVADGDFNRAVRIYSGDEIGQLGMAFNYMTTRLKDAILQQEEEREKLSQILANMSDGVIAAHRDGRIILMNRSAEEMMQVRAVEVMSARKTLYDVLRLPPEEELPLLGQSEPLTMEIMTPNREVLMLRVAFSPLQQDSGKKGGIIAVLQDVTEQARLDQQRREFVANVSHELRTPLTTIRSYVEALLDGAAEDPELSGRFLQVTLTETDRMTRLVNDLLQLSRFDSQGVRLHLRAVSPAELIRYAVDRFSMHSEQQGIDFSIKMRDEELPHVYADQDAMSQVLDNLLSNAIKYTPTGGSVTLQVEVDHRQRRVYVSVTDTGIGIPKRDLRRIFERFYRVDKARSRSQGGTGLGLSIARELVQAHGADISITSELNRGTTVTFWVPFADKEGGA
ncbi:cell wall metabolism sensor histidine kinase WalK [Brevibacillus humidisoli]|uniref:cell wall metabolism sensor histidine kinase WalK n=1 Tax=Brevibacillus humidisoli TaxID=2895522 RepID=UPI001E5650F1|nr:cell wall metabolism sensor histidine kinase WalK [Brevibacillus humidisoli]UFJ40418.1 cell wall metabolism sensor histidine kinase WalK [Brevibacillus humidisoli]